MIGRFGQITPDQARKVAKEWAAKVALGEDPSGHRQEQRIAATMGALFERYLREHAQIHKKTSSCEEDERLIRIRLKPAFEPGRITDITRGRVAKGHASKAATPYRANRALALLFKAMNLAEAWGLRPDNSNPCRHVKKFREDARERYLSQEESTRLGESLSAAEVGSLRSPAGTLISPFAVAAIRLLILTAARKSEIMGLQWGWIDFEKSRADLPDSKTGRKPLFMPRPALELLRNLPRLEGNPYVIARGKPAAPLVNIRDPWQLIRTEAGLDGVRLHDLRHNFESVAIGASVSLAQIGILMGHNDTATTARYAHLADDPRREAANLIGAHLQTSMSRRID